MSDTRMIQYFGRITTAAVKVSGFIFLCGLSISLCAQDGPREVEIRPAESEPQIERRRRGFGGEVRSRRRGVLDGNYNNSSNNRPFGDPRDDSYYQNKWEMGFIQGEFAFARLQYDNQFSRGGNFGFGMNTWAIDFPAADENFLRGVSRLTNVKVKPEPVQLRLDNDSIFDYPFLYALEMGQGGVNFSDLEKENLRQYLLRGGFMLIDDFWGTREWANFLQAFREVFPDRELIELDKNHEIYHVFYDIDGPQMIPALGRGDYPQEQDVAFASNHVMLDDDGRVMVLINWNSDMGDGWEHTYHPAYPTRYANLAYQLGINYLIYALTH